MPATVLLLLAACSAPPKKIAAEPSSPPDAAPPPPTAAELARDANFDRLLDQRGVVNVRVDGDGLIVDLCAAEAIGGVDITGIDVPVTLIPGDWPETVRGEPCGCVDEGVYYEDGERIAVDCNTCTCSNRQRGACTLLSCKIEILDKVFFTRNAALIGKNAKLILDAIAKVLIEHAEAKVVIRGHADANEISVAKLSKKRANAVRTYLIEAGVPKAQLLPIDAVGSAEPLGQGTEADRNVEFVVAD